MNKEIVWDAEERELPGFGVVSKGDKITVPEQMAKSYVLEGLAKTSKSVVKPKEKAK